MLAEKYKMFATTKYYFLKYILLFVSFFLLSLNIFGLQFETTSFGIWKTGSDIIFNLDVSKSMNVADFHDENYYYTRLDGVKKAIAKYVAGHPENRYGLVIFAGEAVSSVPLTDDHDLFLTFLDGVDYKNLIKQGSDFVGALSSGAERFTWESKNKVMIFITDGWDIDDQVETSKIQDIVKNHLGIAYYVVGVGSKDGGKIITGQDVFGRYTYQTYNGQDVVSKLNELNIKEIASALSSPYTFLTTYSDLENISDIVKNTNLQAEKNEWTATNADAGRVLALLSFVSFLWFFVLYIRKI